MMFSFFHGVTFAPCYFNFFYHIVLLLCHFFAAMSLFDMSLFAIPLFTKFICRFSINFYVAFLYVALRYVSFSVCDKLMSFSLLLYFVNIGRGYICSLVFLKRQGGII